MYSAVCQTAFCPTVALSVSLLGVGGVGGGWGGGGGCCRSWGLHQRSLLVLAQMFLCEDARLALGLILVLRCAGCSHWLRGHSSLGPFFEVCPIYLDSLFDVVTQTADPFLAFVAEVVLIPHRFPLEFDCLGPCLPLLWSVYCLVFSRCLGLAPHRLATLASCLHVVSCRLSGLRLLPAALAPNPAMAAAGPCASSASCSWPRPRSRSRTPPARPSRELCQLLMFRVLWFGGCVFLAGLFVLALVFVLEAAGSPTPRRLRSYIGCLEDHGAGAVSPARSADSPYTLGFKSALHYS